MPRLVSLTLLSVLVLPAAALVYFVSVVLGFELVGFRQRHVPWLMANLFTAAVVGGWWVLLWRDRVRWTGQRLARTFVATTLCVAGGALFGLMMGVAADELEIAYFVGGISAMVAWLTAMSVIWRQSPLERAGLSSPESEQMDVTCPRCGYSMRGLSEARCPECGEVYTLDGLFHAQPEKGPRGDL